MIDMDPEQIQEPVHPMVPRIVRVGQQRLVNAPPGGLGNMDEEELTAIRDYHVSTTSW